MISDKRAFLIDALKKEFNLDKDALLGMHLESINHMLRCGEMAEKYAIYSLFNENEVERLTKCALLHDMGKIAISPEILYKKRITEEEFILIKRHVEYDYKYEDEAIRDSIHYHHCCPYGRGYGYQNDKKYAEIHQYAKIVSLLDVYDVLTHIRAYKNFIMSIDEVVEELGRNSDIQFDKNTCESFIVFLKKSFIDLQKII